MAPVASGRGQRPSPRRPLVARPRLVGRLPLEAGSLPRLVLVCAPAGFGKTTILGQWLAAWQAAGGDGPRRVAWLSLDAGHADPRRFLEDVVSVLRSAAPDVGAGAAALLQAEKSPPVGAVLRSLVDDLEAAAGMAVLALDDYHVVEAKEVHEAVAFLVDHVPPTASLALTTRADPPLPVARLRARGELVELRAADLRFSAPEAAAFLNDVMGLSLQTRQVDALESRTEGWPAGLQLAALSLRNRDDPDDFIERFTGSHRFVLDYLVEDVLNALGEADRAFLLDTCVLERLSGPVCDALTGGDDGQARLEALERANVFVVLLDESRQWFRYHHLFADALRARLAAQDPERMQRLHRRAAQWHCDHDRPEEAIPHALAGRDPQHAARLVELALPSASRHRQHRTIRAWLAGLPDDVVRAHPILDTAVSWLRLSDGDVDDADDRLQEAERSLEALPADQRAADDQLRQLPMTIAMYRAAVAQARQDVAGTAEQARRILDLAAPQDHLARGAGLGFLGMSLWAQGDLQASVETFTDAARSLGAGGNVVDEMGCAMPLGAMWWVRGRPDEARRLYERTLQTARGYGAVALPVTGDLHVGLAECLRERGDLAEAAEHLDTARTLGDEGSLPENRHRLFVAEARLRAEHGELDAAADLLDEADTLYLPGFYPDVRPVPALRAQVDITRDRHDLAWDWARRTGVEAADLSYLSECNHLTLARLLLAEGRATDAEELLTRLLTAAELTSRAGSVVEILVLTALTQQARKRLDAAVGSLVRALDLAVPAGYARLFLDEGAPLEDLVRELEGRGLARTSVQELRRAAGISSGSATPPPGPADHELSERELDVLRLLATDLTGPQIARHLFVSVNTLRTHTRHIFTKLDVSTRAAAVRRATQMRLL